MNTEMPETKIHTANWATLISTIPGNISVGLLSSQDHIPLQLQINLTVPFRNGQNRCNFHPEGSVYSLGNIFSVDKSHGTFSGRLLTKLFVAFPS